MFGRKNIESYEKIKDSFFLQSRNVGASKKLVGKVGLITVYGRKTNQCWSEKSKREYELTLERTKKFLESEAKRYGAVLHIDFYYLDVNLDENFDRFRCFEFIKKELGGNTMEQIQCSFERFYKVDEAPVIVAYDEVGRSSAVMQRSAIYSRNEISSIFKNSNGFSYTTIAHEILHQFGAADYYFPQKIEKIAKKYFPNSVMGNGTNIVDELTAYLVGWTDVISKDAYAFLNDTMWYTEQRHNEELEKEWKK